MVYFYTSFYYVLLNKITLFYRLICLINTELIQIHHN
nr:MAG TPA: hypothetical protein [Bacteriophage sp.]